MIQGAIGGLYAALGLAMVAWFVLRVRHQRYVSAVTIILFASLVWRLSLRWFNQTGHIPAWLNAVAGSPWVILMQLGLMVYAVFLTLLLEADE